MTKPYTFTRRLLGLAAYFAVVFAIIRCTRYKTILDGVQIIGYWCIFHHVDKWIHRAVLGKKDENR